MNKNSATTIVKSCLFILLGCSFFLAGCKNEGEKSKKSNGAAQAAVKTPTQKMKDRLHELYATANPEEVTFYNSTRAELFKLQMQGATDPNKKTEMLFRYCNELISAGKSSEAISEIENILKATGNTTINVNDATLPFYDLLALAYLRLGEQDNCIHNHIGTSCILPLDPSAVHQLKTGSSKAIEIFEQILPKYPKELNSIWLLNVAYMTLGEYPHKVPPQWRLPESAFASKGLIPKFRNIATELGVDVDDHAGGVCIEDFNKDGFLDIMASSWGLKDPIRFFVNHGDGTLMDHTAVAGLSDVSGGLNMVHADYNNDGYADIFVLRGAWLMKAGNHPNSLLKNNGNGTFEDVTVTAGVYSEHPTQAGAWADMNLDGYVDLFIGNESGKTYSNPCEMYVNNGDGTFTNMAEKYGLNHVAFVKGCGWGDVNNDGLPDLYLSVFGGENKLYMNRGGTNINDWKFEEVGAKAGVQEPIWSFPTWFFDYDNDGWDDIFVSGYEFSRFGNVAEDEVRAIIGAKPVAELPRVYHNNRNGTFSDVTARVGITRPVYTMGSNFDDINNDGYLDFYLTTGVPDLRSIIPNRMYLNQKGKSFVDVTNDGGFGHIQKGHGVSFGDLDNDGDQDLYHVLGGAYEGDNFRNALFENPGSKNNWIILELEGKTANRSAIGAVVKFSITENGSSRNLYRRIGTGGSFGSSSLQAEVGIGQATKVNSIEVKWPNKEHAVQTFSNVQAGKKYYLVEGGELKAVEYKPFKWQLDKAHVHHHHN